MLAANSQVNDFSKALDLDASSYGVQLTAGARDGLLRYFELLRKWNARVHLVAPCSSQEFARRHVLESLLLLPHLPLSASVADIGSGGGLPIIPCLIARSDVRATLIESARKKAVFLREALSQTTTSSQTMVIGERFEKLPTPKVDFVTCRALERFERLLPSLIEWSPRPSTLLFFGSDRLRKAVESANLVCTAQLIPYSEKRFLISARRT